MPDWIEQVYQDMRRQKEADAQKGGPGSGHWGHAGRPGKRGGSLPANVAASIATGLQYKPGQESIDRAEAVFDDDIAAYARANAITVEEAERRLFTKIRDDLANPLAIRRSVYATAQILDDGEFKTTYETATSGGTFDPDRRLDAENKGLGYPPTYPDRGDKRPIYGYVDTPKNKADEYGDVEWILKESVKERTTVTLGDSLYHFNDQKMVGLPYRNPGKGCVDDRAWYYLDQGIGAMISYWEAQIQGGVSLRDVAKIRLHTRHMWINDYDERHVKLITEKATKLGIPVEVVE